MRKHLGTITMLLLFVGMLSVGVNSSYSDIDIEFLGENLTSEKLTLQLPTLSISNDKQMNIKKMTIDVYDAFFYGNSSSDGSFKGKIQAKFNSTVIVSDWVTVRTYDRNITFNNAGTNQFALVYDHRIQYSSELEVLFLSYYYNYSLPAIRQAIDGNSSNSSNTTTGIVFSEMNITGWDLNSILQGYYANYTGAGYYVSVYNISSDLQKYNGDVTGYVHFKFMAFGNDTNDRNCNWDTRCRQITVYSYASIFVNGVRSETSTPIIYPGDYSTRVNYTDIQNFLRGYYYGVMVPTITNYYNITPTSRTVHLPNYYNDTQIKIDCFEASWYCSGADPLSSLLFNGAVATNMTFTYDDTGYGYFTGTMRIPYLAGLFNSTNNSQEKKENIVEKLQGDATLYLSGQVSLGANKSYHISLNQVAHASAPHDRNNFVQNAVGIVFEYHYYWNLQNFVNSFN